MVKPTKETINKIVQRKNSATKWQVWHVDDDSVLLARTTDSRGLRVKHSNFEKDWVVISRASH